MRNVYDVIKKPLITEKGTKAKDELNKVYFVVDLDANKLEIKQAVEMIFKVHVKDVATIRLKGKAKRVGARSGRRSDWKKAIVTLKEGDKIEFLEGVS